MRTQMVSHKEWQSFFRDFSRIHDGALITVSVAAPGKGSHDEVVNQSLRGINEDRDEIFVHTGNGRERAHLARPFCCNRPMKVPTPQWTSPRSTAATRSFASARLHCPNCSTPVWSNGSSNGSSDIR